MESKDKEVLPSWMEQSRINLLINYSLIAFAFFLPFARSGISVFIGVIPVLWIFEGYWNQKWSILKKDYFIIAIVSFISFYLLSFLWSDHPEKAIYSVKNFGHLILVPVIFTSLRPSWRSKILNAYAVGVLVLLTVSIINYTKLFTVSHYPGTASVFMHHLDYSMILAWSSIYGIFTIREKYLTDHTIWLKENILWLVLVVFGIFWLFVQTGRSGQLAFVVDIVFFSFFWFGREKRKYFFVAFFCIFIALFLQFKFNHKFSHRFNEAKSNLISILDGNYNSSWGVRAYVDRVAATLIAKSPVAGYGAGDGMDVFKDWVESGKVKGMQKSTYLGSWFYGTHFHNQYIQVLMETGFIGFLLFLSMFLTFYLGSRSKLCAALFILLFFTGFIGEPFFRNQFTSAVMSFFMGMLYLGKNE